MHKVTKFQTIWEIKFSPEKCDMHSYATKCVLSQGKYY